MRDIFDIFNDLLLIQVQPLPNPAIIEQEEPQIELPPQRRCGSHTLQLVVVDLNKDKRLKEFRCRKGRVDAKLSTLWMRLGHSSAARELAKEVLGRIPRTPVKTRWNSEFDALDDLLQDTAKTNALLRTLELPTLTLDDVEFLKGLRRLLLPLARALDFLQADSSVLGNLLPVIRGLITNLEELYLPARVSGRKRYLIVFAFWPTLPYEKIFNAS